MSLLADILSSKVRAEVFRLLFGSMDAELHVREIERRSGFAVGTIQTELKKLSELDLVQKRRDGNRLYYQANQSHPLFMDIRRMVLKTSGLADVFHAALAPEASKSIQVAFVFGSIAEDNEVAYSDVDLMVIGRLGLRKTVDMLSGVSERIGREINPYVITMEELAKRKANGDHFIIGVLKSPKIFIIGSDNDLRAMA